LPKFIFRAVLYHVRKCAGNNVSEVPYTAKFSEDTSFTVIDDTAAPDYNM